jgi:hypothetical protein
MEIHHFKNLLDQVTSLSTRYNKINQLTGENFNVFRILKLESSEVRMHSAFLAELLNPRGSHGQKGIFLKLFIDSVCFKQNEIDPESCRVEIEKHTGFITENGTQGGRIDILVTDEKNHHSIVIENKIYAGDQKNQLVRYYNFANGADLIYLTLDGKLPGKFSFGELQANTHFKCISYKHDIINWLEKCRKEVAVHPILRESITIYINLIKHLTNQTINNSMQEELSDLLKANLEAAFLIGDNLDNTCYKLLGEFTTKLEMLCTGHGLKMSQNVDFEEYYTGFFINKPEWKYLNIGFQFQGYDKELRYGIVHKKDPLKFPIPIDIKTSVKALPNNTVKHNDWWCWYNRVEDPFNDWSKFTAWKAVLDGTMINVFEEKIKYLLQLTEGIKL